MAAGQRRLGLAKQARTGVEGLWLAGRLSPAEHRHKLQEVESASERFDALVTSVLERGKLKDWNGRKELPIRKAEQWADAFTMMLDFRNIYERIYRGTPIFTAANLSDRGRRELGEYCAGKGKGGGSCAAPCRAVKVGVMRKRRCVGPRE